MLYITSDTHFFHENINGPDGFVSTRKHFQSTEEMNETIVTNWNNKVTQHDTVIHAGDIALGPKPVEVFDLLKRLHGNLIIIPGNHDSMRRLIKYLTKNNYNYNSTPKFEIKEVGMRIKHNKKLYYVTHFPLMLGEWRANLRNFCGHIHDVGCRESNQLNIGIDSPEIGERPFGEPILFDEAASLVEEKWSNWRSKQNKKDD